MLLIFLLKVCGLSAEGLLEMSIEAYKKEQRDVQDYKMIYSYGYERDGLRAKIFKGVNKVVIAIKGTTLYFHGIGLGPTGHKDREMDNLMFWVCPKGEEDCEYKKKVKIDKLKYIYDLEKIIRTAKKVFQEEIILTGHSLGGALASLMGQKFDLQAIAFSSPGEKYISEVLGFRYTNTKILHIGICEDSLYVGDCGYLCSLMGYSINTTCHLGQTVCLRVQETENIIENVKYHRAEVLLEQLQKKETKKFEIECKGY
ncbi:putative lipase atg15 [Nosema granulosis]|uniref:triacylglycerol lipase n=1 Tax=Nosema granulosis TaxID=83296 RepID=A0A9P6KZW3_9MICR|nr:putative lipase atg15 [Nosema granulosis]